MDAIVCSVTGRRSTLVSDQVLQWLVFLSAAFCFASIGRAMWVEFGPPAGRPRLRCENPHFDFGVMKIADGLRHDFIIQNSGGKELVISGVSTNCSCVSAILDKTTIPPGCAVKLPVRISLVQAQAGLEMNQALSIHSNDPVVPAFVVRVTGRVEADVGSAKTKQLDDVARSTRTQE